MPFRFSIEDGDALAIIDGELDHHAAKHILREMNEAIEQSLPRRLTLDLSNLSFMDSSGIAVVLGAYRRMSELEGSMSILRVPRQAERVLRAAGVARIIDFKG